MAGDFPLSTICASVKGGHFALTVANQKLDLAYIAAGGAIVTMFKLNSSDIIEVTAQYWSVAILVLCLLAYDTFLEKRIFLDWIACKT